MGKTYKRSLLTSMDTLVPFVVRTCHDAMAGVAKLLTRPELLGGRYRVNSSDFIQGGPLPVINGVTTPMNGLING